MTFLCDEPTFVRCLRHELLRCKQLLVLRCYQRPKLIEVNLRARALGSHLDDESRSGESFGEERKLRGVAAGFVDEREEERSEW